jgi:hypothetical protein
MMLTPNNLKLVVTMTMLMTMSNMDIVGLAGEAHMSIGVQVHSHPLR